MHPYKKEARDSSPKWVKGLEGIKQLGQNKANDLSAVVRNYTVNPKVTSQASYEPLSKKGK